MALRVERFEPGQGPATAPDTGQGDCPATLPEGGPRDVMRLWCTRDAGHGPMHEAAGLAELVIARWWDDPGSTIVEVDGVVVAVTKRKELT